MKKRIMSLLTVIFILASFVFSSSSSYVSSSDSLDSEESVRLDIFNTDHWTAEKGIGDITARRSGASYTLYMMAEKTADEMIVVYEPERMPELSLYNELCFDISVSVKDKYSISVVYQFPSGTYEDRAENIPPGRNLIRFRLPEEAYGSEKITLHIEAENVIQSCTLLGVYGDDFRSYSYIERFEAVRAKLPDNAVSRDDCISLIPSKDVSYITFVRDTAYESETVLVTLKVKSELSGVLTVRSGETEEARSVSVYKGEAEYSVLVSKVSGSVDVGIYASEADGEKSVDILFLKTVAVQPVDETVGSVESCSFDGKKVKLKGSIPSDTVVEHIKSKLALYKVPYNSESPYKFEDAEAEISISTSFTLSAAVDYDHTMYKYMVAIVDKSKVIPVTCAVYAYENSENTAASKGCTVGLSNVDAVTVFDSEVPQVVLDVPVTKLFVSPSEGVKTVRINYQDNAYYVNRDYTEELDNHINFSISADTSVCLRLLCQQDEMTAEAEALMCAAASYLCERYTEIDAMIFLSDYPYKGDSESALAASQLLARLMGAVRNKSADCGVMMAVKESSTSDGILTAYYNKYTGVKNAGMYFECGMGAGNIVKAVAAADNASAVGNGFKNTAVYCRDYVESQYKPVYEAASKAGISAVVYTVDIVSDGKISLMVNELKSTKTVAYEFALLSGSSEYSGSYSLWNFRNSYDTFGWLAGGSCLAPQTVLASDGKGRAMKSVVSPDAGEKGVLVCRFDKVTDLSNADNMLVDVLLDVPEGVEVPVKVVLGSTGAKAEYSASFERGANCLNVDLGGYLYANRIEYVALILDVAVDASVEITDVRITSSRLTDDELKAYVVPAVSVVRDMSSLYIFFGGIVSATVIIFVILTKKRSNNVKSVK